MKIHAKLTILALLTVFGAHSAEANILKTIWECKATKGKDRTTFRVRYVPGMAAGMKGSYFGLRGTENTGDTSTVKMEPDALATYVGNPILRSYTGFPNKSITVNLTVFKKSQGAGYKSNLSVSKVMKTTNIPMVCVSTQGIF